MGGKRVRGQNPEAAATPSHDIETPSEPPSKKSRVEASRSLFVRSLPPSATPESLTDFFSQHFPVKHATVVTDPKTKESRGYGFVTFADAEDAKEAKEKLQKHKFDGRPLFLEIAESRTRKAGEAATVATAKKEQRQADLAEARKAPKLIIRNLPWSIKKSEQLAALFQSFGKVKYSDLPSDKGKLSGFGFITMRGHKNAQAAMESLNGKTVDGRTIAVDWAVDKQQWNKQNGNEDDGDKKSKKSKAKKGTTEVDEDEWEKREVEEEEEEDPTSTEDRDELAKELAKEAEDEADEDLRNFMLNHMSNLEEEDSQDEDDDEDDEKDDEEDKDEEEGGASVKETQPKKPLMTDNNTTIFIRNLPFTTTDDQLKAHFEQFGLVRYARIVMDRVADRPAGTGFVCFVNSEDCKKCLKGAPRAQQATTTANKRSILQDESADTDGKYTIEGRVLQVTQAVNKDEANRLTETGVAARQGKDKDKRRLYLLSEGTISHDSPLHKLLAPSEVKIRDQSIAQRKKMIQSNPSLHLSLTRLAVRNLPREIDPKQLKALAREAIVGFSTDVKEGLREPLSKEELARGGDEDKEAEAKRKEKGKGIVRQTKIIFENKQGSKVDASDGAGKSRGYGFIEYHSHRWALMGLRWLNGHAVKNEATGKNQRLIVEFAIENAQVVARRKDFQNRYQAGRSNPNEERLGGDGKFQSRGKDFPMSSKNVREAAARIQRKERDAGKSKEQLKQEAVQQQIIGRKRIMRKKKAQSRG